MAAHRLSSNFYWVNPFLNWHRSYYVVLIKDKKARKLHGKTDLIALRIPLGWDIRFPFPSSLFKYVRTICHLLPCTDPQKVGGIRLLAKILNNESFQKLNVLLNFSSAHFLLNSHLSGGHLSIARREDELNNCLSIFLK